MRASRRRSRAEGPAYPGERFQDWELDDPAWQDVAAVRPVRDEIRRRAQRLLAETGVVTSV